MLREGRSDEMSSRCAQAIGLTLPSLLLRADEVIDS
jgi:hypothetical protein